MMRKHRFLPRPWIFSLCLTLPFLACAPGNEGEPEETAEYAADSEEAMTEEAAPEPAVWDYDGAEGPDAWGDLSADWAACGTGTAQSPIALVMADTEAADLPALELDYGTVDLTWEDTGLGYKATPAGSDNTLVLGEDTYRLLQLHPHTPSEHTLDGTSFPMEIHFVHQNAAGELSVVGVMVEEGEANEAYAPVVDGITTGSAPGIALADLLPESREYLTYDGSLTTPPCSEGVRWNVLTEPITLSAEQLAVFAESHGDTNRPVQPLGDRVVRRSE